MTVMDRGETLAGQMASTGAGRYQERAGAQPIDPHAAYQQLVADEAARRAGRAEAMRELGRSEVADLSGLSPVSLGTPPRAIASEQGLCAMGSFSPRTFTRAEVLTVLKAQYAAMHPATLGRPAVAEWLETLIGIFERME